MSTEIVKGVQSGIMPRIVTVFIMALLLCLLVVAVGAAFAEWTPLVTSADFTGPKTDLLTVAAGVVAMAVVVMAIGFFIRAFTH